MWLYPEIKQYQFIQTDKKNYLFKLNLEGKFEKRILIDSEFKNYFGLDADISVEYVEQYVTERRILTFSYVLLIQNVRRFLSSW
jgi:hypothetical protein